MGAKSLLSGQSGDLMASTAIVDAVREHPAGVENVDTGVDPDLHRDDVGLAVMALPSLNVIPADAGIYARLSNRDVIRR